MAAEEMELYEALAAHFTKKPNTEQKWECVDHDIKGA